jgi:hypothetical protein
MVQAPHVTAASVENLQVVLASFRRHLRAGNLSPRTIETYLEAAKGFQEYLKRADGPSDVALISQSHVEGFMEALLSRWKPATANNRFRALQQFFRFLEEEGDILESPMARMRPPKVPDSALGPVGRSAEGTVRGMSGQHLRGSAGRCRHPRPCRYRNPNRGALWHEH